MNPSIISIVAIAVSIPIIIVPIAHFFMYLRKAREFDHVERIRALEVGRDLPQDLSWWNPIRFAAALAFGVPAIAMSTAIFASTSRNGGEVFWAACLVSVAGVTGGCNMANKHFFSRKQETASWAKPVVDREHADFDASHV